MIEQVWLPYGFLGLFIVLAGLGLAMGWALVRRRGQRESFLLLGLAAALVVLGIVGERADRSGSTFGDAFAIIGLPLAVGLVVAATSHLLVGTRASRWPVIPWAAGGGLALGIVIVVGAMLLLPTPEELRSLNVRRMDTPEPGAISLTSAEVEAISPTIAAGIRAAPTSQGFVNARLSEYDAFWTWISELGDGLQDGPEVSITLDGVGYRIARGATP